MSVLKNVGVIGAGQMGCGIAHVAALAGYTVTLYDLSPERLAKGLATINGNLARQVTGGMARRQEHVTISRIVIVDFVVSQYRTRAGIADSEPDSVRGIGCRFTAVSHNSLLFSFASWFGFEF